LPAAPAAYYLFLLVPAAAVVLGGMKAAKRASAVSRPEAATAGALAGVGFAILAAGLAVLSSVSLKASGSGLGTIGAQSVKATVGAELVTAALLALLWGVVGGALGG